MAAEPRRLLTHEEYFALEREMDQRYEYVAGQVYAMVGGTDRHSEIAANTIISLGVQLHQRPCRIYTSDVRIAIQKADMYVYPDLSVVCGERELIENRTALTNPTAIFEVLSPSTAAYDQGFKLMRYQLLPSLRAYVVIEQDMPAIRAFWRDGDGRSLWVAAEGLDATIALPAIGCALPLAEVYAGVDFAEAAE